jgi:hypothetical protein
MTYVQSEVRTEEGTYEVCAQPVGGKHCFLRENVAC